MENAMSQWRRRRRRHEPTGGQSHGLFLKPNQTKPKLLESEELKLGREVKCSCGDVPGVGWGGVGTETQTQRACEGQYGVGSGAQVGWHFTIYFTLRSHCVSLAGLELAL